jgi:hypothetical protein
LRQNAGQALTDVGTAAEVAPGQYFSSLAEPVSVVAPRCDREQTPAAMADHLTNDPDT